MTEHADIARGVPMNLYIREDGATWAHPDETGDPNRRVTFIPVYLEGVHTGASLAALDALVAERDEAVRLAEMAVDELGSEAAEARLVAVVAERDEARKDLLAENIRVIERTRRAEAAEAERDAAIFERDLARMQRDALREALIDYMDSCPADSDDFVQGCAAENARALVNRETT